jgi:hypothetical protein
MDLPTYDITDPELDLLTEIQLNLKPEELDTAIAGLSPEARAVLREHCLLCIDRQYDIIERIDQFS